MNKKKERFKKTLTDVCIFEALIDASLMLSVRRVVIILDAVVWAARQLLSNVCPLVTKRLMQVENFLFFFLVYGCLIDARIQMVMPSKQEKFHISGEAFEFTIWSVIDLPLATLLASASADFKLLLELVCNEGPLFGTICANEFDNSIVFLKNFKAKVKIYAKV